MIDLATIKVKAGDGGDGAVSFRREKYVPRGGPDGGDGGKGGNVYIIGDHNLATLRDFRSKTKYSAENGEKGRGKNQYGEDGKDLTIKLPVGTLIYELDNGREILVHDVADAEKPFLLARGGAGGVGNWRFRSSTNQAPRQYTKGEVGENKEIKLEIKLVADIGLVGLPNAGKSTLINKLTKANAKVANYPFTTLSPNLGVLTLKNNKKAVISDIPGLIEGASEGKGLGDEFLRHVERTRILVQIIDPFEQDDDSDPVETALRRYEIIQQELRDYKIDLTEKEQIVVINKLDITEVSEVFPQIASTFRTKLGIDVFGISAVTGEGLEILINKLTEVLERVPKTVQFEGVEPVKIYTIKNLPNKRIVYGTSDVFELKLPDR